MPYLLPPPGPAPVIVQKDVGGLVTDYQRQTEIYRREGREVRLMECRSACTMALSLPNVCVYPASVLRFHQAYNRDTKEVDHRVSDELFGTYPEAVRRRLGYLTRQYRSLSGSELIELGVRDCNETPAMYAQRKQGRGAIQVASAAPAGGAANAAARADENPLTRFAGRLTAALTGSAEPAATAPARTAAPVQIARSEPANVPLPPIRPADLDMTPTASVVAVAETESAPTPPMRPAHLSGTALASVRVISPQLPKLITGAWPVLPPTLSAYAPLN